MTERITIYIDIESNKKLLKISKSIDRSKSYVIRKLIKEYKLND